MSWKRVPVILSFLCLHLVAKGQVLFTPRLPESLRDHPEYQLLTALKEIHRSGVMAELDRLKSSAASPNTRFYLEQAINDLPDAVHPTLSGRLAQVNRYTKILGVDTSRLLALEGDLISINNQLEKWKNIYWFSGNRMNDYLIDTALAGLHKEIAFYGLREGEHVAEIGAGQEQFAAAVAATTQGVTYYLNELDTMGLMRIAYHLAFNPVFNGKENRFLAVRGSEQSCGLEGTTLDKIIIRNAFHHFDHPAEMLASVKASLAPQGTLFLKEMYREECTENCCGRLLEKQSMIDILTAAGFELTAEQILKEEDGSTWCLLKWVCKEPRN